jgi:hypothetical protein
MVAKAFAMMDRDNSGFLNIQDISKTFSRLKMLIVSVYDVSMNPDYIEGRKSRE